MKLEKFNLRLVDAELEIFTLILSLFLNQNITLTKCESSSFETFQNKFLKNDKWSVLILATIMRGWPSVTAGVQFQYFTIID